MDFKSSKAAMINRKDDIIQDAISFSSIPGINPQMGGTGEYERIQWLKNKLEKRGIPYEVFEVADDSVPEGKRFSLIVKIPGVENTKKTLWFISHVDTVSAGDLSAWNTDPFTPEEKDGRLYGLGVEDNGQAVISILHTCFHMVENNLQAKCNIGFIFAADEETGSDLGLKAMVKAGVFAAGDEAVVPDYGSGDGSFIEVAEKSVLWLKFTTLGKQAHASMPHLGINAGTAGSRFAVQLEDRLKETFAHQEALFDPPYSTFEATQKFANVESPNVLPGKDEFVMDMRILPKYTVDEVLAFVDKIRLDFVKKYSVRIEAEVRARSDAAPITPVDSQVARTLTGILKEAGVNARCGGIGGGTCGAILREIHIPAVVWSTLDELAHQPNEYTIIDNMIQDAAVFLAMVHEYAR